LLLDDDAHKFIIDAVLTIMNQRQMISEVIEKLDNKLKNDNEFVYALFRLGEAVGYNEAIHQRIALAIGRLQDEEPRGDLPYG